MRVEMRLNECMCWSEIVRSGLGDLRAKKAITRTSHLVHIYLASVPPYFFGPQGRKRRGHYCYDSSRALCVAPALFEKSKGKRRVTRAQDWKTFLLKSSTFEKSLAFKTFLHKDEDTPPTTDNEERDKAEDLIYLSTKNQERVHVHDEHDKLIMRSKVL